LDKLKAYPTKLPACRMWGELYQLAQPGDGRHWPAATKGDEASSAMFFNRGPPANARSFAIGHF
jgi:hypothetical protein